MRTCHVIIDSEPASGAWNMAVDEALLEAALDRNETFLRWYRWQEATISLGYFQNSEDAEKEEQLRSVPRVRRLTGGGAILHHHEITYSCALPGSHPRVQDPYQLYEVVHNEVIRYLHRFGIPAMLRGTTFGKDGPEAFLCFSRGDSFDVVLNQFKVLGSAQRRRKGAVLQHGSLVLARSEFAPQFPGVQDLSPNALPMESDELMHELGHLIGRLLGDKVDVQILNQADSGRATYFLKERYNNPRWTNDRLR